jgi:hypothetical protein
LKKQSGDASPTAVLGIFGGRFASLINGKATKLFKISKSCGAPNEEVLPGLTGSLSGPNHQNEQTKIYSDDRWSLRLPITVSGAAKTYQSSRNYQQGH